MKNKVSKNRLRSVGHARVSDTIGSHMPKGFFRCSLAGAVTVMAIGTVLAVVLAFVIYKTADPTRYITPAALSALYISSLLGGFAAARLNKGSALLCGLTTGALLLATTFIISLPISENMSAEYNLINAVALRAAVLVCSIIGAFIGVSKKTTDKKRRKNYKKR